MIINIQKSDKHYHKDLKKAKRKGSFSVMKAITIFCLVSKSTQGLKNLCFTQLFHLLQIFYAFFVLRKPICFNLLLRSNLGSGSHLKESISYFISLLKPWLLSTWSCYNMIDFVFLRFFTIQLKIWIWTWTWSLLCCRPLLLKGFVDFKTCDVLALLFPSSDATWILETWHLPVARWPI